MYLYEECGIGEADRDKEMILNRSLIRILTWKLVG